MSKRAIIIGAGQIGRAIGRHLASAGWAVDVLSRRGAGWIAPGVRQVAVDREDAAAFDQVVGDGADLLVDTIAFDAADSRRLIAVQDCIGHLVAISSASVYADDRGRTLDEAATGGFPEMPERMDEAQSTVAPGPETYSTRKVAMERALLDHANGPAAVLRPCAIYGIGSTSPREWWAVKRLRDGRTRIPVAYEGESRFQTTSAENMAGLVAVLVQTRASGIFNIPDPDAPIARDIVEHVSAVMGLPAELVPVVGTRGTVGRHPWAIPRPFTQSDAAARAAGYIPAGDYRTLSRGYIEWLAACDPGDWKHAFPGLAAYPYDLFDYAAEDAYFAAHCV